MKLKPQTPPVYNMASIKHYQAIVEAQSEKDRAILYAQLCLSVQHNKAKMAARYERFLDPKKERPFHS